MVTVVFQSCGAAAPRWVSACMDSVRAWSRGRGYAYRQIPDQAFLDLVPADYRARCRTHIQPLTDLARLEAAAAILDEGVARAVWVDADLLIFAPDAFDLPEVTDCVFTEEIWLNSPDFPGQVVKRRVNNSVCAFVAGGTFLPFYRYACRALGAAGHEQFAKAEVGTELLTALHRQVPFPLIRHVGNLSPYVLGGIADGSDRAVEEYRRTLDGPIYAANLCASHENRTYPGTRIRNATLTYERAVRLLLASGGGPLATVTPAGPDAAVAVP